MDDTLDYIIFDSVYNSGGGTSSGGSNDDNPKWARGLAVITFIVIVSFLIYGWCEATL